MSEDGDTDAETGDFSNDGPQDHRTVGSCTGVARFSVVEDEHEVFGSNRLAVEGVSHRPNPGDTNDDE